MSLILPLLFTGTLAKDSEQIFACRAYVQIPEYNLNSKI